MTSPPKPQHIGIVACSAEGAALCYCAISAQAAAGLPGPYAHPEVTLHSTSFQEYVDALERGDLEGIAELMLLSAHKLARIGADFLVCPDNTIHSAFHLVEARSPLPWIDIAEPVGAEAAARGFRRLGILGTRWLVESEVYPEWLAGRGIEFVRPNDAECDEIHRLIMEELVHGLMTPEAVEICRGVIARMKDEGCDAVVLGCTEIPLIMSDENSPLPTLDSTRLLAMAALQRAVGESRRPGDSEETRE